MNAVRFVLRRLLLIAIIARKHFFRNALSSIGLFLSLVVVITILGVLDPLKSLIRQKMEASLPPQTLRLVPELRVMGKGNKDWNLFRKEKDTLMPITGRTLERARHWGKPGDVRSVYATQLLQQPAIGRFEDPILSQLGFSFDLVLQGVPAHMLKPLMRCRAPLKGTQVEDKDKMIDEIPVIVPESYLEIMYAYAMINGLPNISANNLIGLKLRAQLGQSIVGTKWSKAEDALLVVCGFAPPGIVSALGAPLDWVQKKHRERKQTNALNSYDQIFVEISNEKVLPEILRSARAERLRIPEQNKKFDAILKSLEKIDLIFLVIAVVLGGLAAIALANSFALLAVQNRYEFGLYLVFGSSMFFLWFLLAVEGAMWGFIHSALAIWLSEPALHFLQTHLTDMPWFTSLSGTDISQLKLALSTSQRMLIYTTAISVSAMASLIPGAIVLGKKTLALVKKD